MSEKTRSTIAHIRPFRDSDLPAIKDLTALAFEGVSIDQNIEHRFGSILGDDWQSNKTRAIDVDLQRPLAAIFTATDSRAEQHADGKIVGYISTWIESDSQSLAGGT